MPGQYGYSPKYPSPRKFPLDNAIPSTIPRSRKNIGRFPGEQDAVDRFVNSPQFPGQQNGASMASIQQFIRNQARMKGFRFSGGIGSQDNSLQISGTAKFFLGVQFNQSFEADVTLTVNNEVIYQQTSVQSLNPFSNPRSDRDWFPVNRPLSGTDEIILAINSFVAYTNIAFTTYYI